MKQVLFIRPESLAGGKISWCDSSSQQPEMLEGLEGLAALADHPLAARVCLLLPASEMVFRHFSLPKKGPARAAPFSWMAEDTLLGDVDNLHWTVLNKKGREIDAVAIDAVRLRLWLNTLHEAGLNAVQVLPDAWLLPATEGGCTLAQWEEEYWLRFDTGEACAVDATLLPVMLQKAGEGPVRCYGDAPAGLEVDDLEPRTHPLVLIQVQWQRCRVNLLQGAFSERVAKGSGKTFRMAMVAVGVLSLGLLLGPRIAMAWMLVQQENQAQQEIVQLYQHHFPSLRQQTNIKYHFGQNLKKQTRGVFLQLDELEKAKQAVPALGIDLVEYDAAQGTLTLNSSAQSPQAFQDFVNQASAHFDLKVIPVSKQAPWTAMIVGKYK